MSTLLRMENITKSFNNIEVLSNINLQVKRGEIHALLGENGAGKSTLMKILFGIHKAEKGTIYIEDALVHIDSPIAAAEYGITMVHQELNLVPELTVGQNIFLGREKVAGGSNRSLWLDHKAMHKRAQILLDKYKQKDIDASVRVSKLNTAQKQMIEIIKAINFNTKVIIMDEPTASLTNKEANILFESLKRLANEGIGIIYITHRLEELFGLANTVTILRDGVVTGNFNIDELDKEKIVTRMVGRVINQFFIKTNEPTQEKILEVKNLSVESIIRNINFYVRKGEILGIAGLVGAKRSELIRAIFGLSDTLEGQIIYKNSKINNKRPSDALRLKIGYVPEDRKEQGLVLIQPVNRNMTYPILKHFIDFGYIREKARNKKVFETLKKIGFKIEYMKMNVGRLSGGNQQKILIGRYLLADCDLLLLDEPTRGIDVGSKKEIYGLINEFVESGKAVVLVSSEMEEIINMSDRIVVMKEGRITAEFNDRQQFDQEKIMTAMLEEVK